MIKTSTRRRIILDIILMFGAFIAPSWFMFLAASVGLFFFEDFYEIFAVGFVVDGLYGIKTATFFIPCFYTGLSGALFIAVVFLRKHLKFYL